MCRPAAQPDLYTAGRVCLSVYLYQSATLPSSWNALGVSQSPG